MTENKTGTIRGDLRRAVADIATYAPSDIADTDMIYRDIGLDLVAMVQLFASLARNYPQLEDISGADNRWRADMSLADLESAVSGIVDGASADGSSTRASEARSPESEPRQPGIERLPSVAEFTKQLSEADTSHLFVPHESVAGPTIRVGGTDFINFSSFNYLGTNGLERVNRAARERSTPTEPRCPPAESSAARSRCTRNWNRSWRIFSAWTKPWHRSRAIPRM